LFASFQLQFSVYVFVYRALGLTIFMLVSVVIFTPFHSC